MNNDRFFCVGYSLNKSQPNGAENRNENTFIPCQREIARRGLRARNVLNDLKADRFVVSSTATLIIET